MNLTETLIVAIIVLTVPAATLFPIVYGTTTPWWQSVIGRALMVKSTAVLLLIDLSLLVRVFGISDTLATVFRFVILGAICIGVNMQFYALIREQIRGRDSSVSENRFDLTDGESVS